MKLWEKYLLREILRVFFFFTFCFFLVYVLMDFALHMQQLSSHPSVTVSGTLIYYLCQLIKRVDLIFPLAFLIATIKVLTTLNHGRELVALLAGGIPMHILLRPVFLVATALSLFILASFQWFAPPALSYIDNFESTSYNLTRISKKERSSVHTMQQRDETTLLYQKYEKADEALFDVYYIEDADTVWHIKRLNTKWPHLGYEVDSLKRTSDGYLRKIASFDTHEFPKLKIDFTPRKKNADPFENRSISALLKLAKIGESRAVTTHLFFKLIMPFLPLLISIAIPPFCIRFSRSSAHFLIYSLAIFSFVTFFTLTDAGVILATKSSLPPLVAVGIVPGTCFAIFTLLYWKKVC